MPNRNNAYPSPLSAALAAALMAAPALPSIAQAETRPELAALASEGWATRGAARLNVLIWSVYDAEYWTPGGAAADLGEPMALSLTYRRDFTEDELLESTEEELARVGDQDARNFAMKFNSCFGDVVEGSRITAVAEGPDKVAFYRDGAPRCEVTETDAASRFFAIWLSSKSRDQSFTRELKGES